MPHANVSAKQQSGVPLGNLGIHWLSNSVEGINLYRFLCDFWSQFESAEISRAGSFYVKKCPSIFFSLKAGRLSGLLCMCVKTVLPAHRKKTQGQFFTYSKKRGHVKFQWLLTNLTNLLMPLLHRCLNYSLQSTKSKLSILVFQVRLRWWSLSGVWHSVPCLLWWHLSSWLLVSVPSLALYQHWTAGTVLWRTKLYNHILLHKIRSKVKFLEGQRCNEPFQIFGLSNRF